MKKVYLKDYDELQKDISVRIETYYAPNEDAESVVFVDGKEYYVCEFEDMFDKILDAKILGNDQVVVQCNGAEATVHKKMLHLL